MTEETKKELVWKGQKVPRNLWIEKFTKALENINGHLSKLESRQSCVEE